MLNLRTAADCKMNTTHRDKGGAAFAAAHVVGQPERFLSLCCDLQDQ